MLQIAELTQKIKTPTRSVPICLDADLQAEHDELTARLDVLNRAAVTMGDNGKAHEVAARIVDLEEAMRASTVVFRFQGISAMRLQSLQDRFPAREGKREAWDIIAGAAALLSACAVDPVMTEEEAQAFLDRATHGQTDQLVSAAWLATAGDGSVPFSVRASELLRGPAQR